MNEKFENIAISSRIRLARNVSGFNFFTKLRDENDAVFIIDSVKRALDKFGEFDFIRLKKLSLEECDVLFERHIISKELIENKDISAVAVSDDEHLIVMINEEDHIREQCIFDGYDLYKPYFDIKRFDDILLSEIDAAYSVKYGFLTASPANLGAAMRASVMMFLPALEINNEIEIIKKEARSKGFTIRGLYGEGTNNLGSFYQISNQNSLGMNEREIIESVRDYVDTICEMELSAREDILMRDHTKLVDEVYRAYGILKESKLLGEEEMIRFLSKIKFGAALGFLKISNMLAFDRLFKEGCGANLKEMENFSLNLQEEAKRSEYISKKIGNLVKKC